MFNFVLRVKSDPILTPKKDQLVEFYITTDREDSVQRATSWTPNEEVGQRLKSFDEVMRRTDATEYADEYYQLDYNMRSSRLPEKGETTYCVWDKEWRSDFKRSRSLNPSHIIAAAAWHPMLPRSQVCERVIV